MNEHWFVLTSRTNSREHQKNTGKTCSERRLSKLNNVYPTNFLPSLTRPISPTKTSRGWMRGDKRHPLRPILVKLRMSESACCWTTLPLYSLGIILVRNKSKVGTLVFRGENSEGPLKNQLKNDTRYLRKCVRWKNGSW